MSTKLYCGNLPYSATEETLSAHFASAGTVVSVRIIMDKMSGQSKGFGFVEMSSPEEAQAAIEKLNSEQFGGRSLKISEAKPQEPRTGGGDRGHRGGGDRGSRGSGYGDDRGPRGGGNNY